MFILITALITGLLWKPIRWLVDAVLNAPLDTELWEGGEAGEQARIDAARGIRQLEDYLAHPSHGGDK